ncbi:MAG: hypothetical protein OXD29_05570 [Roseovarius sp.]|nr:hypothetical protein [Roseovarius sp.]
MPGGWSNPRGCSPWHRQRRFFRRPRRRRRAGALSHDRAARNGAILAAHRERSLHRIRGAKTSLPVQDGTDLNLATHGGCCGLGVIRGKGLSGMSGRNVPPVRAFSCGRSATAFSPMAQAV